MSIAAPRKSTTRRTLLIAALGVLLLDAFAIVMFGGVGLNGFPGDVIKRALEPIVPYTVIDLGGDPTHVA